MKNIFKLSVMLLAATMAVGCSQNEEQEVVVPAQGDALTVMVTANDFHSVEPASRAVENGYTTTFEAGKDQIGIYALSKTDGKVFIKNRPLMKKEDGSWTGDKIYYYKNTDYIAYFPYTEKLSAETITSEEDIVAYFQSKLTKEQGTKEAYYACDLMSAKIEAANVVENGALNFDFAHKLSMIEVKLPVRDYKTSETDDAYAYYVPVDLTLTVNGDNYTAYAIDKGVYRCIVAPTVEGAKLNVEGSFFDIDAPVTFSKSDIALAAGNYQKLNVNYAYDGYNPIRPLQVGDYYYADGNIYPGDLANPPATNCVGVIFSTVTTASDQAKGWNNGYVVALKNTNSVNTLWANAKGTDETVLDNVLVADVSRFTTLLNDRDGYAKTMAITGIEEYSATNRPAFFEAINYREQCKAPLTSSNWYLPTIGQLVDILNNLGGVDNLITATQNISGNPVVAVYEPILNLQKKFTDVGGELGDVNNNLRWWSCNETSADQSWCIDIGIVPAESKAKYVLLNRDKNISAQNFHRVRPVLAF